MRPLAPCALGLCVEPAQGASPELSVAAENREPCVPSQQRDWKWVSTPASSQPCCFRKDVSFPEHLRRRVSRAEKQLPALGVALLSTPTPLAVGAGALLWRDRTCGARPLRLCLLPEDPCAAA